MAQLLLLEDDPILGRGLEINLRSQGYELSWATSLDSAREALDNQKFDLYLLDLSLPDGSGLDLCKEIRESDSETPVIILTANVEEESVVRSFNIGASDYIKKPFGNRELQARIQNLLKLKQNNSKVITLDELTLNEDERRAFYKNSEIKLNRKEYSLLKEFMNKPEVVLSRDSLIEKMDMNLEINDRTIDSHVSHLRRRLKDANVENFKISSVYGIGYKIEKT